MAENEVYELFVKTSMSTTPIYADVPLWKCIIVYDSPDDALESLTEDKREGHHIRLVEVANNRQLKQMLEPECELAQPKVVLYTRLCPTCPVHWLAWRMTKVPTWI